MGKLPAFGLTSLCKCREQSQSVVSSRVDKDVQPAHLSDCPNNRLSLTELQGNKLSRIVDECCDSMDLELEGISVLLGLVHFVEKENMVCDLEGANA